MVSAKIVKIVKNSVSWRSDDAVNDADQGVGCQPSAQNVLLPSTIDWSDD